MRPAILFGCISVLISIHSSSQGSIMITYIRKYFDVVKNVTSDKTLPILQSLTNNSNQQASKDHKAQGLQPLCSQETNPGTVAPCDGKNDIPACINTSTGNGDIIKCKDMMSEQVSPLCFAPHSHLRFVMSCATSPDNLCFSHDSGTKGLKFCRKSSKLVCLAEDYTLQPCYLSRHRRQARNVPNVPKLDADGYYASCEKCNLQIVMTLDEEEDERPVIEIRSEPLKKD